MHLETLLLRDFRNYEKTEVNFSPAINIFTGQNAQGKTNLLEAIYLLSIGRSFRTANEQELARHGTDAFKLTGKFQGIDGVDHLIEYMAGSQGKSIHQNGVVLRRAFDLFGQVRVVLFSPDDLQLLKGGPEHRRAYLDLYLAQTRPSYRYSLYALHRLLAQRNEQLRLVRGGLAGRDDLAVWNEGLVQRAIEVASRRIEALSYLAPLICSYHRRMAGGTEEISVEYRLGSNVAVREGTDLAGYYLSQFAQREREEISRGLTLVGPHRDDIEVGFVSGYGLRSFGSQGQQRTAALAMKLAAVEFLASNTGEAPILLLDDVLSEFDDTRKRVLLHTLLEANQTVITAINDKEFRERFLAFRAFRVEHGHILEERQ